MKKIFSIFFLSLFLNGCDDGDLTQENIDFESVTAQKCSNTNIIYKVKENEALLIDASGIQFPTEETTQEIAINATNRVIYRFYNGTVTSATLCETIPPANPIVVDEWIGTGGKIVITTKAVKPLNQTDNSTRITGYSHSITFKNITFNKGNGDQVHIDLPFGDYIISATPLPFSFTKILKQCQDTKQLHDKNTGEALILDIDPALIKNESTPLNSPRVGLIGNTINKLTYRLFSGGLLTDSYFCNATYPTTPSVTEEWIGIPGLANTNGSIEVTTTTFGTGFKHTIILKRVKLKKGTNDFSLGDNYVYGELLTTN